MPLVEVVKDCVAEVVMEPLGDAVRDGEGVVERVALGDVDWALLGVRLVEGLRVVVL